jgi:hypothetical protein
MRIPLRRGGLIVAHALVSSADYERLARFSWLFSDKGYAYRGWWRGGKKHRQPMHRDVLGLLPGDPRQADHINRDRLDNRRGNLRIVTRAEQAQNLTSYRGSSSRFRGVSWNRERRKWRATARLSGKIHFLGDFDDEAAAGDAAAAFRRQHMPFSSEAA